MKNKGFTLIELLGVILLISLLSLIAYPTIIKIFEDKTKEIDEFKLDLIYSAAKNYAKLNLSGDSCVFVDELINDNLVAVSVDDFDLIKSNSIVELKLVNNIYQTTLTSSCTDKDGIVYNVISDCEITESSDNYYISNDRIFYFKDNILFKEQDTIELENLNTNNDTSYLNQVNNYITLVELINDKEGIKATYSKGDLITKISIEKDLTNESYTTSSTEEEDIIYSNASVYENTEVNSTYDVIEGLCS